MENKETASIRQGFQMINKKKKTKPEGNEMRDTTILLQKDEDIQSQLAQLKVLESRYADLEKQYKNLNRGVMKTTKDYINNPDSIGKNVYVSQILENPTSTYQGVYNSVSPSGEKAMYTFSDNYTFKTCQEQALIWKNQFFALENVNPSTNSGQCSISGSLTDATKYGEKISSCSQGKDGYLYGGSMVNAVYRVPDAEYVGTFNDSPNRAMELLNGGSQTYSYDSCKKAAADGGYPFFALQDGAMNGNAQCAVSKDYSTATGQGTSTNFFTAKDGHIYGGPWANSLYQIQKTTGNYIGCFNDKPNRAMDAVDDLGNYTVETCQEKAVSQSAKYFAVQGGGMGKSQCFVGNNLDAAKQYGEAVPYFIGSDGNGYGYSGANAIYKLDSMGNPDVVGKAGYLDDTGKLTEYQASMIESSTSIKNDGSCPKNITNIDSAQWSNYKNSGEMMTPASTCGLAQATRQDNQQLINISNQMKDIASQIVQSIHTLESYNADLLKQMGVDKMSLKRNLDKYSQINSENKKYEKSYMPNVSGLLSDTAMNVKHENYLFAFWSILAATAIIITISAFHRN